MQRLDYFSQDENEVCKLHNYVMFYARFYLRECRDGYSISYRIVNMTNDNSLLPNNKGGHLVINPC